jgi:hypothetical protein
MIVRMSSLWLQLLPSRIVLLQAAEPSQARQLFRLYCYLLLCHQARGRAE